MSANGAADGKTAKQFGIEVLPTLLSAVFQAAEHDLVEAGRLCG
jgi:hypothetical protein